MSYLVLFIKVIDVNGGFEDKSYSIIIFLKNVSITKWLIRPLAETRKILPQKKKVIEKVKCKNHVSLLCQSEPPSSNYWPNGQQD